MTFHTDAVADLLGVEEANAIEWPQQEGDPDGVPSSHADVQPSVPSSPSSYLPSVSAGPSPGPDPTISQAGTSRKGKRKERDQTQVFVPSFFYLPYQELVHRAALALKTCEPSFTVYKILKECEPSVLPPPSLPLLQPFAPALELAKNKFGFHQEDKGLKYVKDLQALTHKGLTVFETIRSGYSPALGYEEPTQDDRRQQPTREYYNSRHSSSPGELEPLGDFLRRYGGMSQAHKRWNFKPEEYLRPGGVCTV